MTSWRPRRMGLVILCVGVAVGLAWCMYAIWYTPTAIPIARPGAASQPANAGAPNQGDPGDIAGVVRETTQQIRPLGNWKLPAWDGTSQLADRDLPAAIGIVERWENNFDSISEVSFHEEGSVAALTDDEEARLLAQKRTESGQSRTMDVVVHRAPAYLKQKGSIGQKRIDCVVTPAGVIGTSEFGAAASAIPLYLRRTDLLSPTMLKYANQLLREVPISSLHSAVRSQLPSDYVRDTASYDVISRDRLGAHAGPDKTPEDLVTSYWFNRQTGMLDYMVTTRRGDSKAFADFQAVKYQQSGGLFYPAGIITCEWGGKVKSTRAITELNIKGALSNGSK